MSTLFNMEKSSITQNLLLRDEHGRKYESYIRAICGFPIARIKPLCIKISDTNREGTLYIVILPKDIPLVAEKMAGLLPQDTKEDYFNELEKRREIFERDKWICQYCGEKVAPENATLDHFIPQSKGGRHSKENLKTCCFICNSIKSGKTYEDAAPFLLKSIQERKAKSHSS